MAKTMQGKIKKTMTGDGRKNVAKHLDKETGFEVIREGAIFQEDEEK